MTTLPENTRDNLQAARDLSEADNTLPDAAQAQYEGPNGFSMAIIRGGLLGALGFVTGNFFGNLGSIAINLSDGINSPDRQPLKRHHLGVGLGVMGAVMGMYGGSKLARKHRQQVEELQDITGAMHDKITALQQELKEQIKARTNGGGAPVLDYVDPSWEEEKPKDPTKAIDAADSEKPDATQRTTKEPDLKVMAEKAEIESVCAKENTHEIA